MSTADAEFYRRASEIFLKACDLDPDQRQALMRHECADDQMLEYVQSMIEQDAQLSSIPTETVPSIKQGDIATGWEGENDTLGIEPAEAFHASATSRNGSSLADYDNLKEIAHGGMGVIYRAHQRSLNRDVAIKMIRVRSHLSASDLERFQLEAEATAKLNHPNIVPIYEIGGHEGQPFFSMKLIEGGNLSNWLKQEHDLPSKVLLLIKTALAVHYAHQNGVLHRDIKPANILIDSSGEPHISDFGLAKQLDGDVELTITGQIMGTPGYLSPEQARGQNSTITTASDIYSLGAVLYEILIGQPPFKSDSMIETIRKIVDEAPQRPSQLNPSVDLDLETICLRCLEKSPTDRYASAEALASELQRWMRNEPILSRPITGSERLLKWARRKPALATLSSAMLLTFVVAGFAVIWKWRDAEYQRGEVVIQRQQTRKYLYIAHMNIVQQAWENGMVHEVRRLLDRHLPVEDEEDIRTFEWHFYDRLSRDVLNRASMDYGDIVTFVEASPNGDEIAATGNDHRIQIWDKQSAKRKYTLTPGLGRIERLHYSPDGKTLVGVGHRSFRVWRKSGGKLNDAFTGATEDRFLTKLSHDGRWIAAPIRGNSIQIWNTADPSDTHIVPVGGGGVIELQFLHDNIHFISASQDGAIKIWNVESATAVAEIHVSELPSSKGNLRSLAISSNDKSIAIAADNAISLYQLSPDFEWTLTREIGRLANTIESLIPVGDGGVFAVVAGEATTLWEFETGKQCGTIGDPTQFSAWFDSSAKSNQFATIGSGNAAHIWDPTTGNSVGKIQGHSNAVYAMDFVDDGSIVTGSRDHTIRVSNANSGEIASTFRGHEGWIWSVNYSMDGQLIASGSVDGKVKVWDLSSGTESWEVEASSRSIQFVIFSPDNRTLAAAGRDKIIRLIDIESRNVIGSLEDHHADVNSLSFSSDGRYLASGSNDRSVIVWDVANQSVKHRLDDCGGDVWAVAFAPDDQSIAFGGRNKQIQIWDLSKVESVPDAVSSIAQLNTDVTSLMFSPNGNTLSATIGGGAILLFDYGSRELMNELTGHSSDAMSTSFSPDSRTLVSGCSDGKIRFWNLATLQRTIAIQGHPQHIHCVRFSPDGSSVASASWDGTVRLWSAADR